MPLLPPLFGSRAPFSNSSGFTLIEILVAVSILGISLVVVLQLFSSALKSVRVSDEYTKGIFYANEKMEELLLKESLTSGVLEGEFDDVYRWRVEITRMEQPEEEASKLPFDTFQITVDVAWGGDSGKGKQFQLSTMKVVRKEESVEPKAPEEKEAKE